MIYVFAPDGRHQLSPSRLIAARDGFGLTPDGHGDMITTSG
jgi:hypothetical protein